MMLHQYVGQKVSQDIQNEIGAKYAGVRVVRPGETVDTKQLTGYALLKVNEEDVIRDVTVV